MLLKISVILLLTTSTQQISPWFNVIQPGNKQVTAIALGGNNEEYLFHGAHGDYSTSQIDYQAGSSALKKIINPNSALPGNLGGFSYAIPFGATKAVLSAEYVLLVDIISGNFDHVYTLPSDGYRHHRPVRITGTDFVMVTNEVDPPNFFAYRLLPSSPTSQVRQFALKRISLCAGYIPNTNFYVISEFGLANRKVFDYTNGYDGLTTSGPKTSHAKAGALNEYGFFYPIMTKVQVYVVGEQSQNIHTVNWPEGTNRVTKDLGLNKYLGSISWIPDTNLAVVATLDKYFWITNFMDGALTTQQFTFPEGPPAQSYSRKLFISPKRRLAFFSLLYEPRTKVYKLTHSEYPCSELCETCDEIQRDKCSSCATNAQPTASGESCECKSNYY